MSAFSDKLKQLMEQQELTQSALAAKIWGRRMTDEGIDVARGRDRISVWASGLKSPTKEQLQMLAKALGVPSSDLE
jgi:transcriptional regulator with XRE-family HTH domain